MIDCPTHAVGKSKKARRKKGKPLQSPRDIDQVVAKNSEPDPDNVHQVSSGDEDESKGMKSMKFNFSFASHYLSSPRCTWRVLLNTVENLFQSCHC